MNFYSLLNSVVSPQQIQHFSLKQLEQLAIELRQFIIESVSKTGGHLSSNLGTIELTVALANVFDLLIDNIIWDVGHQTYAYKIITGRKDRFFTLRQYNGLSGFQRIDESDYDHFGAGHASTSISAALGIATARDLQNQNFNCIAVIGDGSMTAGMAFEGLNQAGYLKTKNFIVILNDNDMSISHNVGSLQGYLNQLMSGQYYKRCQERIENAIRAIPVKSIRSYLSKAIKWSEESLKRIAVPGLLFEDLGFNYLGPVNGHNISSLIKILKEAKDKSTTGPVLLHVQTKKGFGYTPAYKDPLGWHGVSQFDIKSGQSTLASEKITAPTYTSVFGNTLTELAYKDSKIVAITAAMLDGTGLNIFQKAFPDRCFDVGIAEQHAVTFAAGLAKQGMRPVVAIYSTFLQRGFDQVFHDICLQNLSVTFAMDRAGLVGADGSTHHGIYDMAYLRCIPNIILMAPKDENELKKMLVTAIYSGKPAAIRYPRGVVSSAPSISDPVAAIKLGEAELLHHGKDMLIVAIGTMVSIALDIAKKLYVNYGIACTVINARFIKPLDSKLIIACAEMTNKVVVLEEGCSMGGFSSAILELLADNNYNCRLLRCTLSDDIVHHGSHDELMHEQKLDFDSLLDRVIRFYKS